MNGPLESDERRVGRTSGAAHPSNLGKGATGAKPADGVPCSNCDLGPSVSTDAPSAACRYVGERRAALTVRELLAWMRDLESGSRKRKQQVPAEIRRALDAAFDAGIVLDNGDVICRG